MLRIVSVIALALSSFAAAAPAAAEARFDINLRLSGVVRSQRVNLYVRGRNFFIEHRGWLGDRVLLQSRLKPEAPVALAPLGQVATAERNGKQLSLRFPRLDFLIRLTAHADDKYHLAIERLSQSGELAGADFPNPLSTFSVHLPALRVSLEPALPAVPRQRAPLQRVGWTVEELPRR